MTDPTDGLGQNSNGSPNFGTADLTNCDREPIHMPGSIQPHGALLVVDPVGLCVLQAGGNTQGLLGLSISELLGRPLSDFFLADRLSSLELLLDAGGTLPKPVHVFSIARDNNVIVTDVTVHMSSGFLILELEPQDDHEPGDCLGIVQSMVRDIQAANSVQEFCHLLAEEVRSVSGFDRVMIYRFLQDGSGVVDAEARKSDLGSYLGLHYPASDIPRQAKQLYLRNWIRLIPDARYTPAPLVSMTGSTHIDLSQSMLRSVSPIHLEYLANMGVIASMSLSIVIKGELWGLIACHHGEPLHLPYRLRVAFELFSQMASFLLEAKIAAEELSFRLHRKSVHDDLISRLSVHTDLADGLACSQPSLLDYIPADGVGVWVDDTFKGLGKAPSKDDVAKLVDWLNETVVDGIFNTDELPALYAPAEAYADLASGLLALSVSKTPRDYILWFRSEYVHTVTWAGNPDKAVESENHTIRLSPRKSFAAWQRQVRLKSRPWASVDLQTAQALRVSLLEVVLRRIGRLAQEREQARLRQEALLAELDERIKQWETTAQELKREGDRRAVVEAELSQILRRTVVEQEAERRRIARELHDSLGQYLTIMQLDLEGIARHADAGAEIKHRVEKLKALTADVGQEVNRLAWEIRPTALDDLGLQIAVQQFLEEWGETSQVKYDLHLNLSDRRLPAAVETALYRTLQEAVTNVVKHAEAAKVGVILEANSKEVRLIIEDNGKGFDWENLENLSSPTLRLGLLGIRERISLVGGTLEVESEVGHGTTLIVHVPL